MSYAIAGALQKAIYQRMMNDSPLTSLVGDAIYDAAPPGGGPELYIALGAEDVRDASDQTGAGAYHDLIVSIFCGSIGFQRAKDVAGAVSDALLTHDLPLERGRLVSLNFVRASAKRARNNTQRRIDMIFRARVEDS